MTATTTSIPAAIPPTPFNPDEHDYTTLPPRNVPFTAVDPVTAVGQIRGVIEHAIATQPRSLQKAIGPSEIGTACDHCLAAKLAGWEKTDSGVAWFPFVGTCVHHEFEQQIHDHNAVHNVTHTTGTRWLVEQRVTVGQIGGVDITGSTDLFDVAAGMTLDHKITGASTLKNVKAAGPSPAYRVQAHLYGRGWVAAGFQVRAVAIWFLPRNHATGFDGGLLWHEPYDEQVALDALARADRIATNLAALAALGPGAVTAWIGGLPRDPHCYDCPRYPDGHDLPRPGHHSRTDDFADLLGG